MGKPKGGTLTRLFEVSERERQEFYENIQKKLRPIDTETGIPTPGTPVSGIPGGGIPEDKTSLNSTLVPTPVDMPGAGIPEPGTPEVIPPVTGVPVPGIPVTPKLKIRRAIQVQDGHSLGEQLVLTTLWNAAVPVEGQAYRRVMIGYRTLSGMCGLTVNNCKANLKSLQAKLAIDLETGYSSMVATTYRVFGFAEILRRREAAGLTHIIRSKGAKFVYPDTGIPVSGIPPLPLTGIPDPESGIPGAGETGIPAAGTLLRIQKEEESKENAPSIVVVVSTAIRKYVPMDDDAVRQIVQTCLELDPHATSEEIAFFTRLKFQQHRKNPSIQNLPGLLIRSVQDYFRPGSGELADFRAAKAQEHVKGRELAQQILEDPLSDEKEREWARAVLIPASA